MQRVCFLPLFRPLLALAGAPAEAQLQRQQKATFVLNADRTAYDPGAPARIAALVSIEHGWHVNSHKPTFEYLIPTVLDLALPAGWPAGDGPAIRRPKMQSSPSRPSRWRSTTATW